MNNDELKKLKELCDRATPGPWLVREDFDYYQGGTYLGSGPQRYLKPNEPGYKVPVTRIDCSVADCKYFKVDVCRIESGDADKEFIIAAREALPKLLDTVFEQKYDLDLLSQQNYEMNIYAVDLEKKLTEAKKVLKKLIKGADATECPNPASCNRYELDEALEKAGIFLESLTLKENK